jgi:hypothetical protein
MSESEKQISEITGLTSPMPGACLKGLQRPMKTIAFPMASSVSSTLGLLNGVAVSIVHLETRERIHVISFRRATRHEEHFLFKSL